jgi:hypothetical protein
MTINGFDHIELVRLPLKVQNEVNTWLPALEAVKSPIQRSLATLAGQLGVSTRSARRKYDAWLKRGWRGLVNKSKLSTTTKTKLAPDFVEWWKKLCLENQRKCSPAYRKFVREFASGVPIPGIGPEVTRCSVLPRGYSYDNLMRFAPTPFEIKSARIGRSAAADFRPKVITSRVGLKVGQRYVFDDLWHDFEVVSMGAGPARAQRSRLLQLHAHDIASACQFARGLKPRIRDEASGKSMQLTQDEMLFLLAHVLSEFGHHPDGCILMVEHGTAAISDALEKLLFDLSDGKIRVDRSGIEGVSSFAGQYPGRGKGNFRFKSSIESLGNLIHNETADLLQFPGQTGANSRASGQSGLGPPEELHGRQKHADVLLNAMADLPASIAAQLRLPFLEVNQAKWLVNEIMERINRRTEHDLESWIECGNVVTDLLVPGLGHISPNHYLSLSPERRAVVDAVAVPSPRKLSPREVFNNGRSALAKLRPDQVARLLLVAGDDLGREVVVGADHLITFEDKNIAPSPLSYLAHHFAPGHKFRAAVNPWALDTLHLFDHLGAWVGQVKLWQRPSQTDVAAITEQMGAAAKVERELLAPVAARGLALTRARLEDARHNADVLSADDEPAQPVQPITLAPGIPETKREVITTITTSNGIERKVFACNLQLREILLKLRDSTGSTWSNAKFAEHFEVCHTVVSRYLDERGCLYHGDIAKLEQSITRFLKWLSRKSSPPHLAFVPPDR